MINIIQNTIGALARRLGIVKKNLQMWLGFTKADVLGAELVENGDFSLGSDDWFSPALTPPNSVVFNANNSVTLTSVDSNVYISQSNVLDVGTVYSITYTIDSASADTNVLKLISSLGIAVIPTSNGTHTVVGTAISTTLYIERATNGVDATISNISVKEVSQFAPDKSTNTNNAKLFTGKALSFDGVNDYVDLNSLTLSGSVMTTALWIKSTESSSFRYIFDINPNRFIFGFNSNVANQIGVYDNSSWKYFGESPNDGSYHRLVLVLNDTSASLYIDGVQLGSTVTINPIDVDSSTAFRLMSSYAGTSAFLNADISDFQIYNTAWTSDDVAYDYANPNNLVIDSTSTLITKSNLIGYWALSEGSGNIAFDSAGLGGELVTNGDFADGSSDWQDVDGGKLSFGVNGLTIDSSQGTARALQLDVTEDGKSYSVNYTIHENLGSTILNYYKGTGYGSLDSSVGSHTFTFLRLGTNDNWYFNAPSGTSITISNISVREVTDNDGTSYDGGVIGATWVDQQPTIPQLGMMDWSKGSNLITYSEDYSNAYWTKSSSTITSGETSPIGDLSAFKVTEVGANGIMYTSVASENEGNMRSIWAKTVSGTGTVYLCSHNSDASGLRSITNEWQRFSIITSTAASNFYAIDFRGSSTLSEILVWGTQLGDSTTLGSYIGTNGSAASNATLIQNPNEIGKDVLGNSLRLREGGFNLDGSGYAEVADDATLQFGTTAFTIQAWIKPSSLTANNRVITKGITGNGEWMISIGTNCIRVYAKDSSGNALDTASTFSVLTLDVWQMITVVIDTPNNQILFYLNDGSVQTKTGAAWTGNFNNTLPITIGNTSSVSSGQFFDGIVDEDLIYSSELSSKEILNNYKAGLSKHQN